MPHRSAVRRTVPAVWIVLLFQRGFGTCSHAAYPFLRIMTPPLCNPNQLTLEDLDNALCERPLTPAVGPMHRAGLRLRTRFTCFGPARTLLGQGTIRAV